MYGDTAYGGSSGNCDSGCGTAYELNKKSKLTLRHSFDGSDGQSPIGGLLRYAKGNLYGTAYDGDEYGTVWKLTP